MPAAIASALIAKVSVVGVVAAVAAVGVTIAVSQVPIGDDAVVERVIDGDTIDIFLDGTVQRVRLLNIDAPEDNVSGESECLGAEATAHLTRLLPTGTDITLQYDEERVDGYDRVLAGVFIGETLINAEVARAGLAGSLLVGDNDRFLSEVSAAEQEALEAQRGIYGTDVACTIGSIVNVYEAQVSDATSAALPTDSATLAAVVASAAALVDAADVAEDAVDAVTWPPRDFVRGELKRLAHARIEASDFESTSQAALEEAQEREAAEAARIAAEQADAAEAARIAAEQAAAAEAERVDAEQAAAAEAARQQAASQSSESTSDSGGPSGGSSSGGGGYDGYTGCRAYGSGGTSIDERGRPYTKIDCITKQPIG